MCTMPTVFACVSKDRSIETQLTKEEGYANVKEVVSAVEVEHTCHHTRPNRWAKEAIDGARRRRTLLALFVLTMGACAPAESWSSTNGTDGWQPHGVNPDDWGG